MNQHQPVTTPLRTKKRWRPMYTVTYKKWRVTQTDLADLCEALSQSGYKHHQITIECHLVYE